MGWTATGAAVQSHQRIRQLVPWRELMKLQPAKTRQD